jgi:hypothetical protein
MHTPSSWLLLAFMLHVLHFSYKILNPGCMKFLLFLRNDLTSCRSKPFCMLFTLPRICSLYFLEIHVILSLSNNTTLLVYFSYTLYFPLLWRTHFLNFCCNTYLYDNINFLSVWIDQICITSKFSPLAKYLQWVDLTWHT